MFISTECLGGAGSQGEGHHRDPGGRWEGQPEFRGQDLSWEVDSNESSGHCQTQG